MLADLSSMDSLEAYTVKNRSVTVTATASTTVQQPTPSTPNRHPPSTMPGLRISAPQHCTGAQVATFVATSRALLEGAAEGPVILDMSTTEVLDSTGLTGILDILKHSETRGWQAHILCPRPRIVQILRVVKMDHLAHLAESEDDLP